MTLAASPSTVSLSDTIVNSSSSSKDKQSPKTDLDRIEEATVIDVEPPATEQSSQEAKNKKLPQLTDQVRLGSSFVRLCAYI